MHGDMPPLPQYVFMAWCSVKAEGELHLHVYLFTFTFTPPLTIARYNPDICLDDREKSQKY
jgi:hypothetical protein